MWRLLDERYARGEHVTVAEMAATADRAPRTVRVHVTVLVRDGYLDIDRRTPLVRCGPPVPGPSHDGMTPRQWAAGLTIECSACRRIMTVVAELADRGWTTRGITQEELARHADMGRRTLGRHLRCHLVEGRWLEDGRTALLRREAAPLPMVADASAPGAQRYVGSSADRYILLSRLGPRPTPSLPGDSWHGDVAAGIVARIPWFATAHGVLESDLDAAIRRVAGHLRDGYPERVLTEMIHRRPVRGVVRDPYALLLSLLPPPGSPYSPPADPVTAEALGRSTCPRCEAPHEVGVPPGVTCRACTSALAIAPF
ncbi:hypothetical protein [Kitasatospora cineracea]|uniref:hypothetical protein n=1 Tax=Kitasatospora cineracea TaxID=88074 RepID=UPI000B11C097